MNVGLPASKLLLVPAFVMRMFDLLDDHDIVVPRDGKYHHPLSAVYRTRVLAHVESLLAAERMRPLFLFQEVDTREVDVRDLKDVDPELNTLSNLNRPSDYLSALERAGYSAPQEIVEKLAQ